MKKIKSTKNLMHGSIIRVYKKGFGYDKIKIVDVSDYFFAGISGYDFFSSAAYSDKIEAYYWLEDEASYEFRTEVIGKIQKYSIVIFDHTDEVEKNIGKKCLMASVQIPVTFFMFDTVKKPAPFSSEKIRYDYGTIVSLSDRNAILKSDKELPENIYIYGHIILDGTGIEIIGKSARSKNDPYLYEIEFRGMGDKERNIILDYVFGVYREQ